MRLDVNSDAEATLQTISDFQLRKNFLCITDLDGSRGVDINATHPAHVIIAIPGIYQSAFNQAIARGSRQLNNYTTATVISSVNNKSAFEQTLYYNQDKLSRSIVENYLVCLLLHE